MEDSGTYAESSGGRGSGGAGAVDAGGGQETGGGALSIAGCGDGVLDSGEDCDDGGGEDDPACTPECQFAPAELDEGGRELTIGGRLHYYYTKKLPTLWELAGPYCGTNAHLATIGSAEEQAVIAALDSSSTREYWIGLSAVADTLEWVDGASYSADDGVYLIQDGTDEDCFVMDPETGTLYDASCAEIHGALCEWTAPGS